MSFIAIDSSVKKKTLEEENEKERKKKEDEEKKVRKNHNRVRVFRNAQRNSHARICTHTLSVARTRTRTHTIYPCTVIL